MIAWFLIRSQGVRPAGKPTADFPNPTPQPWFTVAEVPDSSVPDNVPFDEGLTLPQPDDYPPGDQTGRVVRVAIVGYKHSEYKTSFRAKIVAWGGVVDVQSAIRAAAGGKSSK